MMRATAASDALDQAATYPWTAWQIEGLYSDNPRLKECSCPLMAAPWPQRHALHAILCKFPAPTCT